MTQPPFKHCPVCAKASAMEVQFCPWCGHKYSSDVSTQQPESPAPVITTLKPHRGTLVLIFGILSLVAFQILGPVAWVLGAGDLKLMDSGQMDPSGQGETRAGMICGIIATVLLILGLIVAVIFAILLAPLFMSGILHS